MKPSSFDAEFFTDSDELDKPDMIFFNFWVGPEGDLGIVGAWLGDCLLYTSDAADE